MYNNRTNLFHDTNKGINNIPITFSRRQPETPGPAQSTMFLWKIDEKIDEIIVILNVLYNSFVALIMKRFNTCYEATKYFMTSSTIDDDDEGVDN